MGIRPDHGRPTAIGRAARPGRGRSRRTSRGARRQAGIDDAGYHEGEGHDRFAPIAVMAGGGCTGTGRQNIMPGAFGSNQLKAATSGALPLMKADTSAAGSGLKTMYPWT